MSSAAAENGPLLPNVRGELGQRQNRRRDAGATRGRLAGKWEIAMPRCYSSSAIYTQYLLIRSCSSPLARAFLAIPFRMGDISAKDRPAILPSAILNSMAVCLMLFGLDLTVGQTVGGHSVEDAKKIFQFFVGRLYFYCKADFAVRGIEETMPGH